MLRFYTKLALTALLLAVFSNIGFAQTHMLKYQSNPVMQEGPAGTWDDDIIATPCVMFDGKTYRMWYTGSDGMYYRIGYATSPDGINWEKYRYPVLDVGTAGSWDRTAVYSPIIIFDDNKYKMWYTGSISSSSASIGYATSDNGINWEKHTENPVMKPGYAPWEDDGIEVGSVFFDGEKYQMWYDGWDTPNTFHIGYATSVDGIIWEKHADNPVLNAGNHTEWDYPRVEHPKVIHDGDKYQMWYTGGGYFSGVTGHATSFDGISWTKCSANPILCKGPLGCWESRFTGYGCALFDQSSGVYKMWYSGGKSSTAGCIGLAADFSNSNIARADKVNLTKRHAYPLEDYVKINAYIENPKDHRLSAKIVAKSSEGIIQDSKQMIHFGEELWTVEWVPPEGERNYDIGINVTDEESGQTHVGVNWKVEKFTTVGPVQIATDPPFIDGTFSQAYNYLPIKLRLHNYGTSSEAKNVTAEITTTDKRVATLRYNTDIKFEEIAAGQSKNARTNFSIYFAEGYGPEDTKVIPIVFTVNIFSDNTLYWTDNAIEYIVGLEDEKQDVMPLSIKLFQNYPNPFNPKTTIKYQLPLAGAIDLSIYNLLGKKIVTLVTGKQQAGNHKIEWDASAFASGVYMYRLETEQRYAQTRKLVVLK